MDADVVRSRADSKNGIQERLQRTAAGTHDQISLTDGIGKAFAGSESHLLNADEQCHTESDRPQRQCRGEFPIAQRLVGEGQQHHGALLV